MGKNNGGLSYSEGKNSNNSDNIKEEDSLRYEGRRSKGLGINGRD